MVSALATGVGVTVVVVAIYASFPRALSWYTRRRAFRRWEKTRS